MSRRIKLAIITLHPNNYHDGIWVNLGKHDNMDVTVVYLSDMGIRQIYDPVFGTKRDWQAFLHLNEYRYIFLKNYGFDLSSGVLSRVNPGIVRELLTGGYDAILIHGYDTLSSWFTNLAAKLRSSALVFRGEAVLRSNAQGRWRNWLKRLILPRLFRLYDAMLYSCTGNRAFFEHYGVPSEKLFPVPCAVDNEYFQGESRKWTTYRASTRAELNLGEDVFISLFVGRLTSLKRPMDLLKAVKKLQEEGLKEIGAVFVGNGPERERMERFMTEHHLKNIRIVGFQDHTQIGKFMAIGDVAVVLSEYDRSPKAMNEMMNFAVPVICTDGVGTAPDLVKEGVNGFVVRVGPIEAIANRIRQLAENRERARQMGQKSLEIVSEWNFDRDVEGIVAAVEYALSRKRGRR